MDCFGTAEACENGSNIVINNIGSIDINKNK